MTSSFPGGGAVLLGYVADSVTRNGLSRASVVLIKPTGIGGVDTIAAHSDSTGGFAIRVPVRGRYYYSVRSLNFAMVRDSIDIRTGAETLRVVMRGGPPLCVVQTKEIPSERDR